LAGKMDIFDRRSLSRVCTIDAPNTSYCEWSADGQFILTATLSPRLRVDNGIKIWHCSGALIHTQAIEELYQAGWRPMAGSLLPPFPSVVPTAPAPSTSVASMATSGTVTPSKPAGAYRPPGARGLATPDIFKREDEGGIPHSQSQPNGVNGTMTPPRGYSRSPALPNGHGQQNGQQNGRGRHQRHVPGAPPPMSPSPSPGEGKKSKKTKKGGGVNSNLPSPREDLNTPPMSELVNEVPPRPPTPPPVVDEEAAAALDATAKKVRNLTKKVSSPSTFVRLKVSLCRP